MLKKIIFSTLMVSSMVIYADNAIGNKAQPTPQNPIVPSSAEKTLDIKYAVFDYQMKPPEFSKLLERHNLSKSAPLGSAKNIVLLTLLKDKEFDILQQKLTKEFSSRHTGSTRCSVNNGLCGGSGSAQILNTSNSKLTNHAITKNMAIQFKTYADNKGTSVRIIYDDITSDAPNQANLIPFHSEALVTAVKNKNYVVISQISIHGVLQGQIMLVSFGNNPNFLVSTFWRDSYIKR